MFIFHGEGNVDGDEERLEDAKCGGEGITSSVIYIVKAKRRQWAGFLTEKAIWMDTM